MAADRKERWASESQRNSKASEEGRAKSEALVLRAPRRKVRVGKRGRERKRGGRGQDSYSRAEGPPAIIFKPLQPTLELVEIKH